MTLEQAKEMTSLSPTEIQVRLVSLNADGAHPWTYEEGKLHKEFVFSDFIAAFGFMTRAALVAERQNHHPDWSNVYNRVVVSLSTHEASGVSDADFRLAGEFDALFEPHPPGASPLVAGTPSDVA